MNIIVTPVRQAVQCARNAASSNWYNKMKEKGKVKR